MAKTIITVEFPEKFSEKEVLQTIMEEIDVKTLESIGIKFYTPINCNL